MSAREFHEAHGHLGTCVGGKAREICVRKRGNKFPLRSHDVTPFKDHRPGFRWDLDATCWNEENLEGGRFTFSTRDYCAGCFHVFNVHTRSEFYEEFEEWVGAIRASPYTKMWKHVIVGEVKTDFDGVFREDNERFKKMVGKLGISFTYLPPEHHEGSGERQVGVMEETTKALLMERNLPGYHWGECTKAAVFLLNRYALSHDSLSSDGDAPRPLERLTGGHYSRRRIDRELGYYIGPGTLALVHDNKVKGSHLAAKTRFGVAWGMEGDIVIFKCPYNKNKFRSKSYTIIHLPNYINFYQFLSIPQPKSKNPSAHIRPKDFKILAEEKSILSKLPNIRAWEGDRLKDIKFLDRLNYESDDNLEKEGDSDFDGRKYILKGVPPKPEETHIKSKGGGDKCPQNTNTPSSPKPSSSLYPNPRKRYRPSESYRMELAEGQLPQSDYELKGEQYFGREVLKDFGREGVHKGVVIGTDVNEENGDEIWRVEYEDGDKEDMNHLELMEVLQPEKEPEAEEEEGPMAGMVEAEYIEEERKVSSVSNPPSSPKFPQHPPNKQYGRKKKKVNAHTTTGTENFFEVC